MVGPSVTNAFFRLLLLAAVLAGRPSSGQAAGQGHIRDNDIQLLIRRYEDPYYRSGDPQIDGLGKGQIFFRLKQAAGQQIAEIQQNLRSSQRALDNLAMIGPAAVSQLPVLIRFLNGSSSTDYYQHPAFCDLAKVLPKIDPGARQVGAALGANLLRVQKSAAKNVCHMCGCALDAIAMTKGQAAAVAGDYIRKYMQGSNLTSTYFNQLSKAIAATRLKGIASAAIRNLGGGAGLLPDQKVGVVQ